MSFADLNDDVALSPAEPTPEVDRTAVSIRRSISSIESALTEFDRIKVGLETLRKEHPVDLVFDVSTGKGMQEAIAHRAAWRDPRIAVEKYRKAAKAPVLTLGKDIDARATWITGQLLLGEEPVHQQIKAEEARKEQERLDRENAEFGRVLAMQEAVAAISMDAQIVSSKPSEHIAFALATLRSSVLDREVYQEMMPAAEAARNAAISKLETALKAKQWDEEKEAERQAAERKRITDQAAADAERARASEANRIESERLAKIAAEQRAAQEKIDASLRELAAAREAEEAQRAARLQEAVDAAKAMAEQIKPNDQSGLVPGTPEPNASAGAEAAQIPVNGAEGLAAHAEERAADPVILPPHGLYRPLQVVASAPVVGTLHLGAMSKRLRFVVTSDLIIGALKVTPASADKRGTSLFTEDQFTEVCRRLIDHIQAVAAAAREEAAV